ncbi:hypothetical protein [Streptomyces sp. TRM68367]|uniref:hypothetical protein n=1 Tax=Streptomyces sp. TRM68367 TaxID=2758415 RepID=UPI00165BCFCA|nr:hypothetical protein [Streptomyces sp. TRM68367]MBC9731223.1 hypothetical protein [Streptomyces sp. TRM68367]
MSTPHPRDVEILFEPLRQAFLRVPPAARTPEHLAGTAVRTLADMLTDTSVDTPPDVRTDIRTVSGEVIRSVDHDEDGRPVTSTDTARTRLRTAPADASGGVRIEYRARVPRHLAGAAFAEALGVIAAETGHGLPDGQGEDQ